MKNLFVQLMKAKERSVLKSLLSAIFIAVCVPAANAVSISNQTSGLAAPDVIVDFDAIVLPVGTPVTNQFFTQFVSFSGGAEYAISSIPLPNLSGGFLSSGSSTNSVLEISFGAPVRDATFFWVDNANSNSTFTAFLGTTLIDTFTAPVNAFSPASFYGFSNIIFDRIVADPLGATFALDNLAYNLASTSPGDISGPAPVPVPAALPLLAGGLGLLGLLGWRRKRVS